MKVLLDEGVPRVIQKRLPNLSIFTVEEMKWRGIRNGRLLDLMAGEFDVLVTTDKNLRYQQNLEKRQIAAVILPTNQIPLVIQLLPQIEEAITTIATGSFKEVKLPPAI